MHFLSSFIPWFAWFAVQISFNYFSIDCDKVTYETLLTLIFLLLLSMVSQVSKMSLYSQYTGFLTTQVLFSFWITISPLRNLLYSHRFRQVYDVSIHMMSCRSYSRMVTCSKTILLRSCIFNRSSSMSEGTNLPDIAATGDVFNWVGMYRADDKNVCYVNHSQSSKWVSSSSWISWSKYPKKEIFHQSFWLNTRSCAKTQPLGSAE